MEPSIQSRLAPHLHTLLHDLNRVIGPIYLTGGVLRDCLIHQPPSNDLDILVPHALSVCQQRLIAAGYLKVIIGGNLNSLLLPLKHKDNPKTVAIASFRHRPNVEPSVTEDLRHRDISVNAMAYLWPDGPLIDPFNGRQDLEDRRIRLVNGAETLRESGLRAIRFFRFILQLDSYPDPDDLRLSEETVLTRFDPEQVRAEMDRILSLPLRDERSQGFVMRLFQAPLGTGLLPEFAALREVDVGPESSDSVWQHSLKMMLAIGEPAENEDVPLLDLRWTALLHETGKAVCTKPDDSQGTWVCCHASHLEDTLRIANRVLDQLEFSRRRQRRILSLISHLDFDLFATDRALRRLIENNVPLEGLLRLLHAKYEASASDNTLERQRNRDKYLKAMRRCQLLRQTLHRLSPQDLAITGGEIIDFVRIPAGPWVGRLQSWLVDWVTTNPERNRREILEPQVLEWVAENVGF